MSANIGHTRRNSPSSPEWTGPRVLDEMIDLLDGLRLNDEHQWNVFALQEVDRERVRSGCEDQAWEIDDSFSHYDGSNPYTGYGHVYATTLSCGSGTMSCECSSASAYGIALVTNHRLDEVHEWPVGCGSAEPRSAIALRMVNAPTPLWIINTHLHWGVALCQVEAILDRVEAVIPSDDIVLVVGDFNISKEGSEYWQLLRLLRRARFREIGGPGRTVPVQPDGPNATVIDYGFIRDPRLTLSRVDRQVVDPLTAGSGDMFVTDHRLVVFDMHWGTPLHAAILPQL